MDGGGLRLVVWNCNGGFRLKHSALGWLQPDIAIIPEATEDFAEGFPAAQSSSLWVGVKAKRGIGVLALNGWSLERADVDAGQRYFLPCVATRGMNRIHVIAVCAKKTTDYVSPTLEALQNLSHFISAGPSIFAGDFNGSVIFDDRRTRPFALVIDSLDSLGMRSAWHHLSGEKFGEETAHTYFMYRKDDANKRFHIDYAFVSKVFGLEAARIGSYAEWRKLSDHAPLSVDLWLPHATFAKTGRGETIA